MALTVVMSAATGEVAAQLSPRHFVAVSSSDSVRVLTAWFEGRYVPAGSDLMAQVTHVRLHVQDSLRDVVVRSVSSRASPCWGGLQHVFPPSWQSQLVEWRLDVGVTVLADTLVFRVPMSQSDPVGCRLQFSLRDSAGRIVALVETDDLRTARTWGRP